KYHLIYSSNEQTWKFDRPVVFLGENCRLFSRKFVWSDMDAIVAKPFGLGQINKDENYTKVKQLEEKIFPDLVNIMNRYHGYDYDQRFWEIILGHWFKMFIPLAFKKISTLKKAFDIYNISGTTITENENYKLATQDYGSSIDALYDEQWSHFFSCHIIKLLNINNFPLEILKEDSNLSYFSNNKKNSLDKFYFLKKNIKKFGYLGYTTIARKFVKENDAFIINSYLPFKEEIKIEISLGQLPQLWTRHKLKLNKKPNNQLRNDLARSFEFKQENDIDRIISILLFELLPICYLEGFEDLKKITESVSWPKFPKFIFTSNNFHSDEVFKLWSAIKVQNGTKYFIGQHGNNYGTLKNSFPRIEEKTADKFFTWGWKNNLQKFVPAFIFKTAAKKQKKYDKKGKLLLIESSFNEKYSYWDSYFEFIEYFEDQKKFISNIDKDPRKNLILKLDPNCIYKSFNEYNRWLEFDPNIKIELRNYNIFKLISKSRIVVHSYDSTGILETLSLNIPTVAFWQNNLDHLCDNVKSDYRLLLDAGIIHLSAKSASEKINQIWNDVDSWWNQNIVQDARKKFIEIYARNNNNPSKKIISLLTENLL
ncbi:LIC12162 family protein, partial [Candidatus Pelagibacter sp.]|nr:LIC12162 family protein [Candidatus Pelagibacter sp.]